MTKEIVDNSFENFKDMYDVLSVGELSEQIKKTREILSAMERLMEDKTVKEFPYGDKYIKIYNGFNTSPIYMHCSLCKFDNTGFHDEPMIWFHGTSFRSEFGPYEDSNYVKFSTGDDVYMSYRRFFEQETVRKKYEDSDKKIPYGYDSYMVVIIGKEEYNKAYNDMLENMKKGPEDFCNYVDFELDEETEE